jgi:hypothetical protein
MSEPNTALAESRRLRRCKTSENAESLQSEKFRQPATRRQSQRHQSDGIDSFIVAFMLLLGNHLMLWYLVIGGAILFPHIMQMRDAIQILQYQRGVAPSVAPILRQD